MDKKRDRISLIIKEADKEISSTDIDFITNLITEWLIKDYLQREKINKYPKSLD